MEVAEICVFPSNVADADVATVNASVQADDPSHEVFHDCDRKVHFREPEVERTVYFTVKSITVETATRAKQL
eukprot:6274767-Amphidinium_carterae.1